jgi:endoglucanase
VLWVPPAARGQSDDIRLNQIGYYSAVPKYAAVAGAPTDRFVVVRAAERDTVFHGTLAAARTWGPSGESVRLADFSALRLEGMFELVLEDGTASHPFRIGPDVHESLGRAALKGFYFQRASLRLEEAWAGRWHRPAGHPDTAVRVHASAASPGRPTNTLIAAPKGWYDAGDYNKYIVNSGITMHTLLSLYEHFPDYARAMRTGIPESGGPLPDLLAEARWNLDWMLAMQDPYDGGVYHKLTNANFDGIVMPHQATSVRYVVMKSTAATLDFAAVMALASRIFQPYDAQLADSMLNAALRAWTWAHHHPAVYYNQRAMNQQFSPAINTGEYGDSNVADEFAWAGMELYVTTGADSILAAVPNFVTPGSAPLPGWPQVRTLGYYSILHHADRLGPAARADEVRQRVLSLANSLRSVYATSEMRVSMTQGNFYWGSNSVAANQGIALIQAFRMTNDSTYLHAAIGALDYLLGRNGTTYSFVTGHGGRTPMRPHHRQSEADGIPDPVPGLLVGGPNPGRQDGCTYPSTLPARAYVDSWCSYASNEVAINWNAPLAYLSLAVEAIMSKDGLPTTAESPGLPADPAAGPERLLPGNYPNPFTTSTRVSVHLRDPAHVRLAVYDALGRRVAVLTDRILAAGRHEIDFEPGPLPAGVYLVRLQADHRMESRAILFTP